MKKICYRCKKEKEDWARTEFKKVRGVCMECIPKKILELAQTWADYENGEITTAEAKFAVRFGRVLPNVAEVK